MLSSVHEQNGSHPSWRLLRSAWTWQRTFFRFTALMRAARSLSHDVRLMPPAYVKPYVKRGKTDAADAEAVCEAVRRPTMRFVPVKSPEQQAVLSMHRTRDLSSSARSW